MKKLVSRLTRARSLFKLRNTSCFLINLKSAISLGSRKACYMASAMYPAFPCWNSLMEELAERAASSNTKEGFQAGTAILWSCPLSTIDPSLEDLVWVVLAALAPFCGSTSLGRWLFPSSTTSLPFESLFLLLSADLGWRT